MTKRMLLLCLICLFLTCSAVASDQRNNNELDAASLKDPFLLGELHLYKKEYGQALKRFEEAVATGSPGAENRIGELYRDGLGVNQSYQTAAQWFLQAAARMYAPAQVNAGLLYESGLGGDRNYEKALSFYLQAARQKDAIGAFKAGYFLENGLGTEKNARFAIGWYSQAAEAGNVDAMLALASMCLNGQEKPNYNGARVWYLRAANRGSAEAEKRLGDIYEKGQGVQQDIAEAIKWYKSAADKGNKEAAERLRVLNIGNPAGLLAAAEKGDTDAMYNLAVAYDEGTGLTVDHVKAAEWYLKAARKKGDAARVYQLELSLKLFTGDFDGLEGTARDLRQKQEKSATGAWLLSTFYDAVSLPMERNRGKEQHWSYVLQQLQKWNKAFPHSITARIALAQYYTESPLPLTSVPGADSQDSEQAGDGDSLAQKILEEALTLSERCPQWYAVMLKVGQSEGWDETRLEALFDAAIKAEPTYLSYYAIEVERLARTWPDRNIGWIPLAEKMEAALGGRSGGMIFSEIAWLALRQTRDAHKFMQSNLPIWGKIKQGLEYRQQVYGRNNYDLNRLCYLAIFAGDKDLARRLFTLIGNDWSKEVFPYQEVFDLHKRSTFQ